MSFLNEIRNLKAQGVKKSDEIRRENSGIQEERDALLEEVKTLKGQLAGSLQIHSILLVWKHGH